MKRPKSVSIALLCSFTPSFPAGLKFQRCMFSIPPRRGDAPTMYHIFGWKIFCIQDYHVLAWVFFQRYNHSTDLMLNCCLLKVILATDEHSIEKEWPCRYNCCDESVNQCSHVPLTSYTDKQQGDECDKESAMMVPTRETSSGLPPMYLTARHCKRTGLRNLEITYKWDELLHVELPPYDLELQMDIPSSLSR